MATGYVLVNVDPGSEYDVFGQARDLKMVVDATLLFGDYDLILKLVAPSMGEIAAIVVEKVRQIPGVRNTKTLAGAEL